MTCVVFPRSPRLPPRPSGARRPQHHCRQRRGNAAAVCQGHRPAPLCGRGQQHTDLHCVQCDNAASLAGSLPGQRQSEAVSAAGAHWGCGHIQLCHPGHGSVRAVRQQDPAPRHCLLHQQHPGVHRPLVPLLQGLRGGHTVQGDAVYKLPTRPAARLSLSGVCAVRHLQPLQHQCVSGGVVPCGRVGPVLRPLLHGRG